MNFSTDPSRYLPHRPPMMLLDEVLEVGEESVRCRASSAKALKLFAREDGTCSGSLFIELMAQTIAVYAGVKDAENNREPNVGFLLGTRNMTISQGSIAEGDEFEISANCSFFGGTELPSQFECAVFKDGFERARATLSVYRPADVQSFAASL